MTTTPWRRTVAALATATILPFALSACGDDSSGDDSSNSSSSNDDNSDDSGDAADDAAEKAAEDALEEAGAPDDVDIETGGDLPDGFPDSIPVVGEVEQGAGVDVPGGQGWSVTTSYDGSAEAGLEEASTALTGAGFEDQTGGSVPGGGLFSDGTHSVSVSVVETAGETVIAYAVAPAG